MRRILSEVPNHVRYSVGPQGLHEEDEAAPRTLSIDLRHCSGDVRNRVVDGRQIDVLGPGLLTQWRASLHLPRRPQAQVLADVLNDYRILDSSAMTRVGPLSRKEDRVRLPFFGHSRRSAS